MEARRSAAGRGAIARSAGSSRKTFAFRFSGGNSKHWKKSSALRPSGLIGPVRIAKTTPQTAD